MDLIYLYITYIYWFHCKHIELHNITRVAYEISDQCYFGARVHPCLFIWPSNKYILIDKNRD